jgi:hypothetical protein
MDDELRERFDAEALTGMTCRELFLQLADEIDESSESAVVFAKFILAKMADGNKSTLAKTMRTLARGIETDPVLTR